MLYEPPVEIMKNNKQAVKIGVFDSGIGGLSVANAIEKALPHFCQ